MSETTVTEPYTGHHGMPAAEAIRTYAPDAIISYGLETALANGAGRLITRHEATVLTTAGIEDAQRLVVPVTQPNYTYGVRAYPHGKVVVHPGHPGSD